MKIANKLFKAEKRSFSSYFDGTVLALALILSALGVLMVFTITGGSIFNNLFGDITGHVARQLFGVVLGIVAMFVVAIVPHQWFHGKIKPALIGFTLVFLLFTAFWGQYVYHSPNVRRWIQIGGLTFQAIDVARFTFILSVAWIVDWFVKERMYHSKKLWSAYVIPLFYVLICVMFIFLQPDLGSGTVLLGIGMAMFFSSGIHKKQIFFLLGLVAVFIGIVAIVGTNFLQTYQLDRIMMWRDPFNHPRGDQSAAGFASIALGGIWGVGLGNSTQVLGFAIEPHTDLVASILAEELGIIGIFFVLVFYFVIAFRAFSIAFKSKRIFNSLVCIGIGTFFIVQPFVNMAGVSGLIPLTGIALPLISYGMTSTSMTFALIGLYFNMRRQVLKELNETQEEGEMLA